MRYANAQAELNRREREHQSTLARQQLQIAEAQAEAANAAVQSSTNAARATRGLVYLGIITVLIALAALAWQIFAALHLPLMK